jgi:hypothetical protein
MFWLLSTYIQCYQFLTRLISSHLLHVISGPRSPQTRIDRIDGVRKFSRQRARFNRVKTVVELLDLRCSKNDAVSILSVQYTMEDGPAQGSCVSADSVFLCSILNSAHCYFDRSLAIVAAIYLSNKVLLFC